MVSDTDDFEEIPPTADRVAARALVLSAVVCRSALEGDAGNLEAENFRREIVAWIHEVGLLGEVERDELALLESELGALTDRQRIDASWRAEGLIELAWALGVAELPRYDERADPYSIAMALGFRSPRPDTVAASPRLRSLDELRASADTLLALHWRLRQYSIDRKPMNFRKFAETAWFGPLPVGQLQLVSDDLEVRGLPIWETSEEVWREALSIARERQQAANWLLGQDELYSQVTCDT